jgi:hypothetical protein
MATTTIQIRAIGPTAPGSSTPRPVDWLRIAAGTLLATLLIIGLMAAAGRFLPAHPDGAKPTPGAHLELVAYGVVGTRA